MRNRIQVVVIALIKKNGKYLLTKRYDPKRKLVHGTWQLPGGGLEFNETIIECLHREISEETGLKVKVEKLIPYIHEEIFEKDGWHGVIVTTLCKLAAGKQEIILDHEGSDWGWFTLVEIVELKLHFGTKAVINEAKKYL